MIVFVAFCHQLWHTFVKMHKKAKHKVLIVHLIYDVRSRKEPTGLIDHHKISNESPKKVILQTRFPSESDHSSMEKHLYATNQYHS